MNDELILPVSCICGIFMILFAIMQLFQVSRGRFAIAFQLGLLTLATLATGSLMLSAALPVFVFCSFVIIAVAVLRRPVTRKLIGFATRPYVIWSMVAITGATIIVAGSLLHDWNASRDYAEFEKLLSEVIEDVAETREVENIVIRTDRGERVPVLLPVKIEDEITIAKRERQMLPRLFSKPMGIQRTRGWDESNCHGWVFTAGNYHIGGSQIDLILKDNGYQECPPQIGCLAVYRNMGIVMHSGIVRAILSDQNVLIESKWGLMGQFLHLANQTPYGSEVKFYTSNRMGHLLQGLQDRSTPDRRLD